MQLNRSCRKLARFSTRSSAEARGISTGNFYSLCQTLSLLHTTLLYARLRTPKVRKRPYRPPYLPTLLPTAMPATPKTARREIPHDLRVTLVVMRYWFNLSYGDIAQKLGLRENSVASTYRRITARARDPTVFKELLIAVDNLERSGRPRKIEDGSRRMEAERDLNLEPANHPSSALESFSNTDGSIRGTNHSSHSL